MGVTLLHYATMRALLFVSVLAALSACSRDKKSQDGLPPAQEWKQDGTGAMVQMSPGAKQPAPPPGMAAGGGNNPHGGGMGNDPHAGLGIDPADPHAGMDMGGSGGGPDVAAMGLPSPDPNRAIDPTRYVKGVIKIHEKAKARAKAGIPLFIVVKRVDASGQATGTALAVDKLTWNNGDLVFELTEKQAMVGGTELVGEVIVTARYDQDGDALSKEAGDIVGTARVKLPADNVQIVLDTIL